MSLMFYNATAFHQELCWDVSNVTFINNIFMNSPGRLDSKCLPKSTISPIIQILDDKNIRKSVDDYIRGNSTIVAIENWDTSQVTDMSQLFHAVSMFNSDISQWDVSNVMDMTRMFQHASSFNINLNQWDVSNVGDMWAMFYKASSFNADISFWDVSNVSNMKYMFKSADLFNRNISKWNVSHVSNMAGMFSYAFNFNENLSQWDISNVSDMNHMFSHSISLRQKICWDVSNVISNYDMFANSPGKLNSFLKCIPDSPSSSASQETLPTILKYLFKTLLYVTNILYALVIL